MPNLPETAPQFRGKRGKDDLHAWLAQARLWFARVFLLCKGNASVTEAEIAHIFSILAFEQDTPARFWFEASQDQLLQTPPDGNTIYEQLLAAVKPQFAHIAPDPDQQLADMQLTP
eukprot:1138580-Pelagomonas_calceolata.AAC.1